MKTCSICGKEKEESSFGIRDKKKGTRRKDCKQCSGNRIKKWAQQNTHRMKQIQERFYKNHLGKNCLKCGNWYKPKGDIRFCSLKCNLLGRSKIQKNKCVEWQENLTSNGYGKCCVAAKTQSAHRISYQLFKGEIPKKMLVLHRCDNRKCINPEHLYLGDQKQNIKDMDERGRRGKRRFFLKYSFEISKNCFNLKKQGLSYKEISEKEGIPLSSVIYLVKKYVKS